MAFILVFLLTSGTGCQPPICGGLPSFVLIDPPEDSVNDYTLIDSRSDFLLLERQGERIEVRYPDIGVTMSASIGDELRVERWAPEAPWIAIRRISDKALLFEAGFPPTDCGGEIDVHFCPIQSDRDFVCRFEQQGGRSETEVKFETDDGPVRLQANESAMVTLEGRSFHAEVFFAQSVDPSSGDGLTAFSQSILVALE